jgi:hypothetical protein
MDLFTLEALLRVTERSVEVGPLSFTTEIGDMDIIPRRFPLLALEGDLVRKAIVSWAFTARFSNSFIGIPSCVLIEVKSAPGELETKRPRPGLALSTERFMTTTRVGEPVGTGGSRFCCDRYVIAAPLADWQSAAGWQPAPQFGSALF